MHEDEGELRPSSGGPTAADPGAILEPRRLRAPPVLFLKSSAPSQFYEEVSEPDKGYPHDEADKRRKDDASCRSEPIRRESRVFPLREGFLGPPRQPPRIDFGVDARRGQSADPPTASHGSEPLSCEVRLTSVTAVTGWGAALQHPGL